MLLRKQLSAASVKSSTPLVLTMLPSQLLQPTKLSITLSSILVLRLHQLISPQSMMMPLLPLQQLHPLSLMVNYSESRTTPATQSPTVSIDQLHNHWCYCDD